MSRLVALTAAVATASAAYASHTDLVNHYETLTTGMNLELTPAEREFHIRKFAEYMAESGRMSSTPMAALMDAMPAMPEARAKKIAATASFETDIYAFANRTQRDVASLLGRIGDIEMDMIDDESAIRNDGDLPEFFDLPSAHPECPMISLARDQGNCGSCWAMAAVAAFNDRLCISSKGDMKKLLSTQFITSCSTAGSCEGGWESSAWKYMQKHGVPTGGEHEDEDSGETCYPYYFHKCAHHMETDLLPACSVSDVSPDGQRTPKCSKTCTSKKYPKTIDQDRFYTDKPHGFYTTSGAKKSLMTEGSMSAAFRVHEDFLLYKGGVYAPGPNKGRILGGHAIRVIGWGVDDKGKGYWDAMNSWNELWGENGGRFRVTFGVLNGFYAADAPWPQKNSVALEAMEEEEIRM